jgi:hypothetical protein
MVGLLPLVAASLSLAAPPASPTPTSARQAAPARRTAPETRPYDGTLEATMPDATIDIAAPADSATTDSATTPAPEIISTPDPTITTPEVTLAPEPTPKPRTIPRILTTMTGWYPGEIARHSNAAGTVTFTPDLQTRAAVGSVSEFSLDDAGNTYAEGAHMFGRVRWHPTLTLGKKQNVSIVGMLDLANGRWVPTTSGNPVIQELLDDGDPPQRYGMYIADPRELYVQWTSRYGQLRAGQMAFNWGLGLVANDGNNMDRFGDMKFGDDGIGSINERVLFATKPLARSGGPGKDLLVAIAADLVYRDPLADLTKGDTAGQAIVVVRWEPSDRPGNSIGAYGAYRRQRSGSDGDTIAGDNQLEVGVFDFAGQGFRNFRDDLALLGAFEVAAIAGRSTFAKGEFARHRVLQAAAALRAYVGNPDSWLVGADGGFATGDADPDDDELNDFEAAPGFTAGLLMFQYVRGWQSARTEIRAEDPELTGVPPNGTQYLPTRGTVTNTVYFHPKARWGFHENFELWGGPLIAGSAVPIVDAYSTRLNGGSPHNSLGGVSTHRYMGTELDVGLRGRYGFKDLWLQVGLQGGILFPGRAFQDAAGDRDKPTYGGWFRAEIRY